MNTRNTLRSIAVLLFCICAAVKCFGQTAVGPDFNPVFADMKWGTPSTEVRQALTTKGFKVTVAGEGDLKFEGRILNIDAIGMALMAEGKLSKVTVFLVTSDRQARRTYDDMKEVLMKKYGEPSKCYEFFSSPYREGDGYEEQAIRVGKGTFACFWQSKLSVEITDRLTVRIAYESESWSKELDRRKAKGTSVF